MKPVYVINGFLDSGKTSFINYTLAQPYFRIKGVTLLIVCEEGEEEYDKKFLSRNRIVLEYIGSEKEMTANALSALDKKHKPERIVIEYNGMWNYKNFRMPVQWTMEQQLTMIDATTFPMYYTNMKSLLAEMLRKSEMIIFNRCDGIKELSSYKRNVKAVNQEAEIIFEGSQGEINEIMEEELPYDLKADVIELDDHGYGIWYLDTLDHPDRYEGKKLSFTAMVMKPMEFREGYFVPGRMAMTCCAEDMAFLGYACAYDKLDELKDQDWVRVTVRQTTRFLEEYGREGPVLEALKVQKVKKPEKEIIDFT